MSNLIIIGGGSSIDKSLKHAVTASGKTVGNVKIAVISSASADPELSAALTAERFAAIGIAPAQIASFDFYAAAPEGLAKKATAPEIQRSPEEQMLIARYAPFFTRFEFVAREKETKFAAYLNTEKPDIIFMAGGDQRKLGTLLRKSGAIDDIRKFGTAGGLIAGTSAGAAIQSTTAITGYGHTKNGNWSKRVPATTGAGLGLLPDKFIIDTHYAERHRFGRTAALIAANPDKIAIGLNENTGAHVKDDCLSVIGEGNIYILAAPTENSGASLRNIALTSLPFCENFPEGSVSVYKLQAGDRYNLVTGQITPAPGISGPSRAPSGP